VAATQVPTRTPDIKGDSSKRCFPADLGQWAALPPSTWATRGHLHSSPTARLAILTTEMFPRAPDALLNGGSGAAWRSGRPRHGCGAPSLLRVLPTWFPAVLVVMNRRCPMNRGRIRQREGAEGPN
jgi:hypothetical protein